MANNNYFWWSLSPTSKIDFYNYEFGYPDAPLTTPLWTSAYAPASAKGAEGGFHMASRSNIGSTLISSTLSSFLFHFCALISFISLGGVRTLIKFYFILISKITKILSKAHKINLFPKTKYSHSPLYTFSAPGPTTSLTSSTPCSVTPVGRDANSPQTPRLAKPKGGAGRPKAALEKGGISSRSSTLAVGRHQPPLKISFLKYLQADSRKTILRKQNSKNVAWPYGRPNWCLPAGAPFFGTNMPIATNKGTFLGYDQGPKSIQQPIVSSTYFKKIEKNDKLFFSTKKSSSRSEGAGRPKDMAIWKEPLDAFIERTGQGSSIFGKIKYYSFLKLLSSAKFSYNFSFYTYLLLLKSVDVLATPASFIYKFFEKPGTYVVENLAYSFLVEWSADLITTIPDTIDTTQAIYFAKINQQNSALVFMNSTLFSKWTSSPWGMYANMAVGRHQPIPFYGKAIFSLLNNIFFFGITNSIIKRFFNSSFLVFIKQICEPDLDSINREKKGTIFWDIWGEYLKTVAEENSINIYELTTDKEEQIRLLSKYEETTAKVYGVVARQQPNQNKRGSFVARQQPNQNNIWSLLDSNHSPPFRFSRVVSTNQAYDRKVKLGGRLIWPWQQKKWPSRGKDENIGHTTNWCLPTGQKYNYNSWSVNQFLSYQGKGTDLFIDLHPPKTFYSSAASLKYSFSVQQPIGSIVCQIFSGIFYKQISKNILVIGSSGIEKSLLIQAIAGETELKIITDNAHRYAMVYRGVAVGIKLLRDVFEALSVHAPCIFLMEDIHAIGERRPFLIDESSSSATESTYNKNQSMQGLFLKEKSNASRELETKNNKHLLSHYKKPYKELRSLATNHFSFTFLYGDISRKNRKTQIKQTGSALSVQVLKKETQNHTAKNSNLGSLLDSNHNIMQSKEQLIFGAGNTGSNQSNLLLGQYSSSLLIKSSKENLLSPPASSPFSVLILKEATKLKHKKIVKEMPWFGLPGEQFSLISKYNYSIRVKIALLADLVLSNLSVKLDMITDLLVIIDSVKGNRGFVVFATTHVPYILDPALRRPGRFDETISLPLIPTLYSRWFNSRYNVHYLNNSIFTKYTIPLNFNLNKGTSLNLTKYNFAVGLGCCLATPNSRTGSNIGDASYSPSYPSYNKGDKMSGANNNYLDELINSIYTKASTLNQRTWFNMAYRRIADRMNATVGRHLGSRGNLTAPFYGMTMAGPSGHHGQTKTNKGYKFGQTAKSKNYSYVCKSLISLMLYTYRRTALQTQPGPYKAATVGDIQNVLKWPSMFQNSNTALEDYSIYLSLFSYPFLLKIILMSLIGSKLGENFATCGMGQLGANVGRPMVVGAQLDSQKKKYKQKNQRQIGRPFYGMANNQFLFNFDNTWKYASSLLLNYIQKRQCSAINKNLAFCSTKLLSFNNNYSLMEAPSPPISNILLPSKRYENYKRTFNNQNRTLINQHNFDTSVSDKIQFHQQQRMLKRLYKYPIKEFFRSHILNIKSDTTVKSNFSQSNLILNPLEKTRLASLNKISSINSCYKNIIYNRHRTYLTNQWWNAQQGEHNAETTFLSDIDWRYTFVPSFGDVQVDFPDSDQFYNPRNRRWMLTKGDWNSWFNVETELKTIYSHYIYECFAKVYKYLDQNREIMDFYVELLAQNPDVSELKERDLLNLYKRFSPLAGVVSTNQQP